MRTTPDLPAVPTANANALREPIFANMDGREVVQWLTVQAGDVAGTLQLVMWLEHFNMVFVFLCLEPKFHRLSYDIKRMNLLCRSRPGTSLVKRNGSHWETRLHSLEALNFNPWWTCNAGRYFFLFHALSAHES